MKLDPVDDMKMSELCSLIAYFSEKYGHEMFPIFLSKMMAGRGVEFADMDEDHKSLLFNTGLESLKETASIFHDQLFPFGHAGEALEVES